MKLEDEPIVLVESLKRMLGERYKVDESVWYNLGVLEVTFVHIEEMSKHVHTK